MAHLNVITFNNNVYYTPSATPIKYIDSTYTTFADYQNTAESLDELTRQDKEVEIKNLQQRIQNFQQSAQQTLQDEEIKLLEPVMAKARKAIEDVATEGNYTYIFDQSNGTILYAKESENVLDLVKKKLNL